jgi:plasmid maintenance system antidote protein VapI
MALQLEQVLGSTAQFWLNLEAIYRTQLSRLQEQKQLQQMVKGGKPLGK